MALLNLPVFTAPRAYFVHPGTGRPVSLGSVAFFTSGTTIPKDVFADKAGVSPPVRGGSDVPPDVDAAARLSAAHLAGHNRVRASGAYLGGLLARQAAPRAQQQGNTPGVSGDKDLPERH